MNFMICITLAMTMLTHSKCLPAVFKEAKVKRAVFYRIPYTETRGEEESAGSPCKCDDWAFLCIRDEHLVCRRTLTELQEAEAQVVDRVERRRRRKNRRHLR